MIKCTWTTISIYPDLPTKALFFFLLLSLSLSLSLSPSPFVLIVPKHYVKGTLLSLQWLQTSILLHPWSKFFMTVFNVFFTCTVKPKEKEGLNEE